MKQVLLQSARDTSLLEMWLAGMFRGRPIRVGAGERRNSETAKRRKARSSEGYFAFVVHVRVRVLAQRICGIDACWDITRYEKYPKDVCYLDALL